MNFAVANFDPAHFADPFRFDVTRRPPDSLAFGSGAHRCVGRNLARLEARVAFEELLARFPAVEPRGPATYRPTLATAWMDSLPVSFGRME
jgi:cytochrome P450